MEPLFEIQIDPVPQGSREAGRVLHAQLNAAIADGRLAAGTRLPPTRRAKAIFGVSRNTLADVYERLVAEGRVATRPGSGVFVCDQVITEPSGGTPRLDQTPDPRLNPIWAKPEVVADIGFWRDPASVNQTTRDAQPLDFRPALVDARLFPFDVFRRVSAKQLRGLEIRPAAYRSPQGNPGNWRLRHAVSRHIGLTRGVVCGAQDVLIAAGAQQGFDLIARVLVHPGQTVVAVEDPGYPPMRAAFAAAGARLVPIRIDAEGLVVDELPDDVGVVCVCPSHQFPLGVTLSSTRRKALIDFARARNAVIVEDDYDGEFRYEGGALEALRTAEAADVVFYVGTFSKCMLPSLRLGFVIAPPWAMQSLIAAKNCSDWHCPTPLQTAVAGFISEGHLTRHVRRLRKVYGRRRKLIQDTLKRDFRGRLEPIESFYGLHTAAYCVNDAELEAVVEALAARDVRIHTLSRYGFGPGRRTGLVLGYGALDLEELAAGLNALSDALPA